MLRFYQTKLRLADSYVIFSKDIGAKIQLHMASQDKNSVFLKVQGQTGCTFCRTPVDASSSCNALEEATLRNLYTSLQIYEDPSDLERLTQMQLPLCTRCRDKVVILSCNWQTYMLARKNFENVRNDLAFATIDSHNNQQNDAVNAPGPPSPMDRIREKICESEQIEFIELLLSL